MSFHHEIQRFLAIPNFHEKKKKGKFKFQSFTFKMVALACASKLPSQHSQLRSCSASITFYSSTCWHLVIFGSKVCQNNGPLQICLTKGMLLRPITVTPIQVSSVVRNIADFSNLSYLFRQIYTAFWQVRGRGKRGRAYWEDCCTINILHATYLIRRHLWRKLLALTIGYTMHSTAAIHQHRFIDSRGLVNHFSFLCVRSALFFLFSTPCILNCTHGTLRWVHACLRDFRPRIL